MQALQQLVVTFTDWERLSFVFFLYYQILI